MSGASKAMRAVGIAACGIVASWSLTLSIMLAVETATHKTAHLGWDKGQFGWVWIAVVLSIVSILAGIVSIAWEEV